MRTNTHSTQECCGFVWALFPCLVSCAGSGSVVAPELMVSRFFYRRRAECCMFRPSCCNLTTLRLWVHSSKLLSSCMMHPGCPRVRPEACAHQIQNVGGRRSSVVLSPNADGASLFMFQRIVASKKLSWACWCSRNASPRLRCLAPSTRCREASKLLLFALEPSAKQHALSKSAVSNTENHQVGLIPFESGRTSCVGVHSAASLHEDDAI